MVLIPYTLTPFLTLLSNSAEILRLFDYARNVILPLQSTFPHERVHMDVLMLNQYCGRLLILFHALAQLRAAAGLRNKEKSWFVELEKDFGAVKTWGVESVNVSQVSADVATSART